MPVISFELGSSSANEHPATVKSSCQTSSNRLTHKNSTIAEEGRSKEGVGRGATSSLAKAEVDFRSSESVSFYGALLMSAWVCHRASRR